MLGRSPGDLRGMLVGGTVNPSFHLCPMASESDHPPRNGWGNPATGCCPANAVRFLPSIPSCLFSTDDGVWVHLYDASRMDWNLADGTPITVDVQTRYPWDGRIELKVETQSELEFSMFLRIPAWANNAQATVNGTLIERAIESGSYLEIRRRWLSGDSISLELPMPVVAMTADPRATDFQDKTALMRGPLLYCFEGVDNPGRSVRRLA